MAICPYCHSEKPMTAPVCHECNTDTPFLFQVGISMLRGILTCVFFYGTLYLLYQIIMS